LEALGYVAHLASKPKSDDIFVSRVAWMGICECLHHRVIEVTTHKNYLCNDEPSSVQSPNMDEMAKGPRKTMDLTKI
jgi:hypothetical protein